MAVWNPRANELFLNALEIASPAQRKAQLDKACGQDAPLRKAVEELLQAHAAAGSVLEPTTNSATPTEKMARRSPGEGAGAIIGNYKLLQLIGEGGFGTVFMAEQDKPVRRRVALKIIKLGMDTKQVIARFEAERQALAMMDHPNIAKILDAGATASGRPYFVMELVKGISITKYCDTHKLSTEARLGLFVAVCNALQHAHQKGIIHRDIKPGNVLVTLHDGKPVPKLIDFGIAKATQFRLTEKTLFTEFRHIIGTLEYMSPEQAEMSGLDVDTRSDIYSLGVLLYELLTGTTPFDRRDLCAAAYGEMQRIIREVDPPKPSTRLSTLGEPLSTIAANRAADPRKLRQQVRGELDWIVMKSLEKDRTRRYESAGDLARDVGRHLDDQPVEACPPRTIYRLKKFARRNRTMVLTTAAVLTVAVAAAAIYIHGIRAEQHKTELALSDAREQRGEAEKQRQAADQQRDEARRQERIAASVNELLSNMLSSADPKKLLGDKVTVLQAIEQAVKQWDADPGTLDPLTEASLRNTIGKTFFALARYDEAEPNLRKALAIRRRVLPAGHVDIAASLINLAALLNTLNKPAEAEPLYREAIEIARKALPAGRHNLVIAMADLGNLLKKQNRPAEAEPLCREALEIDRKALPATDPEIAGCLNNLAELLTEQNKPKEAEAMYREALAIDRKALPAGHPQIADDLGLLGVLLERQNKVAQAEPLLREALEIRRKALPAGHPDIAESVTALGMLLADRDKLEEAEKLFRDALEAKRKALPVGHPYIATDLNNLAGVLRYRNKPEEAEKLFREALEINRKALPAGHPDIAMILTNLANFLADRNKLDEAESMYREALAIRRKSLPEGHPDIVYTLKGLAHLLERRNKPKDAEKLLREAVEIRRKAVPAGDVVLVTCLTELGNLLEKRNKLKEAESLYREALAIDRKARAAGTTYYIGSLDGLSCLLARTKRVAEAEPLFREMLAISHEDPRSTPLQVANSETNLGSTLSNLGKYTEAEPLLRDALPVEEKELGARGALTTMTASVLADLLERTGRAGEAKALRASHGVGAPATRPAHTRPATRGSTPK